MVKISDEEVEFLWDCTPQEGAEHLLKECGVALAMVTLGPKGCYLKNHNASVTVVSPVVSPIDTTGAGDIFGGSAVARLLELGKEPDALQKEDLAYIARYAATAASFSTEYSGGSPSIPDKMSILSYLLESQ